MRGARGLVGEQLPSSCLLRPFDWFDHCNTAIIGLRCTAVREVHEGVRREMPTYDYLCENGHRFELFQSMKDDPLTKCQECDAPVKRLIGTGAGFLFKGDGFYITDYRSKEYKKQASADSSSSSSSSSSASSSKSDSSSGDSSKPSKPKDKGSASD
jgi:putative FmdB family regulatory protein